MSTCSITLIIKSVNFMREIRFRALETTAVKPFWIYFDLSGGYTGAGNPDTIGQFTGLQDKNGKEIYEGDVVEESGRWMNEQTIKWEVIFANSSFNVSGMSPDNLEVIGNIYENPELLNNNPPEPQKGS